jgi:hypothetical protein
MAAPDAAEPAAAVAVAVAIAAPVAPADAPEALDEEGDACVTSGDGGGSEGAREHAMRANAKPVRLRTRKRIGGGA